ncbi:hypothetical protein [Knoellia subterranea]|uniref:Uncharacterized protein n=1 Tax=Knoellia subterranea KCTC 19937 TaxID=1385521 RepID=A0A0A0JP42_9MICO|nr:hypothetical protein [Knoellia subterranea]KGN37827.1 hypothetical protein N803_12265 [Knoellia subterranea KCTC 19937]
MIPRTHTLSTAHRIADKLRNFRRPGTSGWSTVVDMDSTRASHELMVASQFQQVNRSI